MLAAETKAVAVPVPEAANSNVPLAWKRIAGPVEPFLEAVSTRLRKQIQEFDPAIEAYATYALTGQGKQLRPLLVALSANAAGSINDAHVTVAAIIEMVHLATLVHDDVMDEAEIRRGRRTLATNWGNEIAVLLGDCLFANALKLAASFPTPEICRAVAAATNTVCAGEILQTRRRSDFNLTLKDYYKILEMKTAELFALSCDLAAHLSDASGSRRHALREFGLALGTAYQMYDDCLDIFGTESVAGKSLGTDLTKGKLTLPILLLRDHSSADERAKLQELLQDWQPESLTRLRELLARHRIWEKCLGDIERHLAAARQILATLPEGREGLAGLTDLLAHQTEMICA